MSSIHMARSVSFASPRAPSRAWDAARPGAGGGSRTEWVGRTWENPLLVGFQGKITGKHDVFILGPTQQRNGLLAITLLAIARPFRGIDPSGLDNRTNGIMNQVARHSVLDRVERRRLAELPSSSTRMPTNCPDSSDQLPCRTLKLMPVPLPRETSCKM